MQIVKPRVLVPADQLDGKIINRLERCARICYKSENSPGAYSGGDFLKHLLQSGHESVIEHEKITVLFIVDRGISHEIVRHRIASYSQESTRYCNYSKGKFGEEITVIEPYYFVNRPEAYGVWKSSCLEAEQRYMQLMGQNCTAQEARAVLPNSLKTELAATMDIRSWRNFFRLRATLNAHPQMKQVAIPLLLKFQVELPALFEDLNHDKSFPIEHYAEVVLTDELFN